MISLIAAVADNNCIGKNNQLPWYLPEDLKHFRKLTTGKVVVMGRKTWESIPAERKPLPQRVNVVITRQENFPVPAEVEVYGELNAALSAHRNDDVWIIGGAELYRQTLPLADRLFITRVHQAVDGDVFFPSIDMNIWKETEREDHDGFSFVTYQKV